MKKLYLLLLFPCITFAIHPDDLGLEKLGTIPDEEAEMIVWSYLPSSIKKKGNLRNVWVYQNHFAKSSLDNDGQVISYYSAKAYVQFNCSEQYGYLSVHLHEGRDWEGKVHREDYENPKYKYIAPNSVVHKLQEIVCK